MLDGQVGDVGDDDAVAPLLRGRRDLRQRDGFADGRDAFLQLREGQRQALEAGRGVGDAAIRAQRWSGLPNW